MKYVIKTDELYYIYLVFVKIGNQIIMERLTYL